MPLEEIDARILTMAQCLDFLPGAVVDERTAKKISYGQKLGPNEIDLNLDGVENPHELFFRVTDETGFLLAIVQPAGPGQAYNYSCVFRR